MSSNTEQIADIAVNAATGSFTVEAAQSLTSNIIWLMGMSFILGVFFTTFLLLLLEFVRRNRGQEEE